MPADTQLSHEAKPAFFSAFRAFADQRPSLPPQQATSIRSIKSLVPLLDRVLVQRIKAEAKTASGIFLPESSVKELNEGKVLAVGPGGLDREGKRVPMGVQAGDRVLIPTVRKSRVVPLRRKEWGVRRECEMGPDG